MFHASIESKFDALSRCLISGSCSATQKSASSQLSTCSTARAFVNLRAVKALYTRLSAAQDCAVGELVSIFPRLTLGELTRINPAFRGQVGTKSALNNAERVMPKIMQFSSHNFSRAPYRHSLWLACLAVLVLLAGAAPSFADDPAPSIKNAGQPDVHDLYRSQVPDVTRSELGLFRSKGGSALAAASTAKGTARAGQRSAGLLLLRSPLCIYRRPGRRRDIQ